MKQNTKLYQKYKFPEDGIFANKKLTYNLCLSDHFCKDTIETSTITHDTSSNFDSKSKNLYVCTLDNSEIQKCFISPLIPSNICLKDRTCKIEYSKNESVEGTANDEGLIFGCHLSNIAELTNTDLNPEDYCVVMNPNFILERDFNDTLDRTIQGKKLEECKYKSIVDFKAGIVFSEADADGKVTEAKIPGYIDISKDSGANFYNFNTKQYDMAMIKNSDFIVTDISVICVEGGKVIRTGLCSNTGPLTFENVTDNSQNDYVGGSNENQSCGPIFNGNLNGNSEKPICALYEMEKQDGKSNFTSELSRGPIITSCTSEIAQSLFGLSD